MEILSKQSSSLSNTLHCNRFTLLHIVHFRRVSLHIVNSAPWLLLLCIVWNISLSSEILKTKTAAKGNGKCGLYAPVLSRYDKQKSESCLFLRCDFTVLESVLETVF